jgi:hypothetical protein
MLKQTSVLGEVRLGNLKQELENLDLKSFKQFVQNLTKSKAAFVIESPSI